MRLGASARARAPAARTRSGAGAGPVRTCGGEGCSVTSVGGEVTGGAIPVRPGWKGARCPDRARAAGAASGAARAGAVCVSPGVPRGTAGSRVRLLVDRARVLLDRVREERLMKNARLNVVGATSPAKSSASNSWRSSAETRCRSSGGRERARKRGGQRSRQRVAVRRHRSATARRRSTPPRKGSARSASSTARRGRNVGAHGRPGRRACSGASVPLRRGSWRPARGRAQAEAAQPHGAVEETSTVHGERNPCTSGAPGLRRAPSPASGKPGGRSRERCRPPAGTPPRVRATAPSAGCAHRYSKEIQRSRSVAQRLQHPVPPPSSAPLRARPPSGLPGVGPARTGRGVRAGRSRTRPGAPPDSRSPEAAIVSASRTKLPKRS